jgi:hypothetical protein
MVNSSEFELANTTADLTLALNRTILVSVSTEKSDKPFRSSILLHHLTASPFPGTQTCCGNDPSFFSVDNNTIIIWQQRHRHTQGTNRAPSDVSISIQQRFSPAAPGRFLDSGRQGEVEEW